MADDLTALNGRPGWTVTGSLARYKPVAGGWVANVRLVLTPGKTYSQWHISAVDARGRAQHTRLSSSLGSAISVAEGTVRGLNRQA